MASQGNPPPYDPKHDYPPQQWGNPPQGGYPQAGYAPQGGYPPPQGGYPPPQAGYPPPQGYGYPPQQGMQHASQSSTNVVVVGGAPSTNTVIVQRQGVNHCLHCLITFFFFPWVFVWIFLCITEGS